MQRLDRSNKLVTSYNNLRRLASLTLPAMLQSERAGFQSFSSLYLPWPGEDLVNIQYTFGIKGGLT